MSNKGSELFKSKESGLLYNQAIIFQNNGELDSALLYLNKADIASPNTAIILHERGLVKYMLEKYDEAIVDVNKSIELTTNQKGKEIRISNRALIYMKMGKMKEACNDWKHSGKRGKSYIKKYCK